MVETRPARRKLPMLAAVLLTLPVFAAATPALAQRDPLQAAYDAALANPGNIELQLQYARMAEAAGKIEAAFPVYERVLQLQPGNREAQAGLRRIRAQITPPRRDIAVEFGGAYESNPLHVPLGANGEFQLYGNVNATAEHALGTSRWRTVGRLNGTWHAEQDQLNYGYAGALTGPLIDVGALSAVHLALGGGISSFGGRLFYYEGIGQLTVESGYAGATQTLRLRGGWREYDPFWVSDSGFWADITGKFILPKQEKGGALVFTPWGRWTNFEGSFITGVGDPIEITPGRYVEGGARLEYLFEVSRRLSAGLNLTASAREYLSDVVPSSATPRRDANFSPGVSLVASRVLGNNADIRFRYNYIVNNSNDNAHDWQDHYVTLGVGGRF
jgi:hypothetical protein